MNIVWVAVICIAHCFTIPNIASEEACHNTARDVIVAMGWDMKKYTDPKGWPWDHINCLSYESK